MNRLPYVIYLITCLINGKRYVGQTKQSLRARIGNYRRDCRKGRDPRPILCAMRKHQFDSFLFEELDRADSIEELNDMERYWIAFYGTSDRHYGYNVHEGGISTRLYSTSNRKAVRCVETNETFVSMSAAARAHSFTASALTAHLNGRSKSCNGLHWHWIGVDVESEPTAKPLTIIRLACGKRATVQCLETGEKFSSLNAAAKQYGVTKSAIYVAIERKIAAGGMHWRRLVEKRPHRLMKSRRRQVEAIETATIYPSITEAARMCGVIPASIWCAIRKGFTVAGLRWRYAI